MFLNTSCRYLSVSVFEIFIKNVYVSAMRGELHNLSPVAAQQDAFLPPSWL